MAGIFVNSGKKANLLFEKGQPHKAKIKAYKAIRKDSLNPLGFIALSRCFIYTPRPKEIDSANIAERKARSLFQQFDEKDSLRYLKKTGKQFDWKDLRKQINTQAFRVASSLNQVSSYQHFIDFYAGAPQVELAMEIRDSLAYEQALAEGTSEALNAFLEKYPESRQANQAVNIRELFLYKEKTGDGHWESFHRFYLDHPNSSFSEEAQFKLFQLKTFRDDAPSYQNFTDSFPENQYRSMSDSLLQFKLIQAGLLPTGRSLSLLQERTGVFHDNLVVVIPGSDPNSRMLFCSDSSIALNTEFDSIRGAGLFQQLKEPWLFYYQDGRTSFGHVYGKKTLSGAEEIEILNRSWLVEKRESGHRIRHFLGKTFLPSPFDQVERANSNMFFGKRGSSWNAYAPNGHQFNHKPFDSLFAWGNLVLALRDSLWLGFSYRNIVRSGQMRDPHVYENLDWTQGFLISQSKNKRILIDQNSGFGIESSEGDRIIPCPDGWLIENHERYELIDETGRSKTMSSFKDYISMNYGFAYKPSGKWILNSKDSIVGIFDSISTYGSFFNLLWIEDSLFLHGEECLIMLDDNEDFRFLFSSEKDRYFFIQVDQGKYKSILSPCGEEIFKGKFDEATPLSPSHFRIKSKGKFGLADTSGTEILKPEFDFVSQPENGFLTLFKKGVYTVFFLPQSVLYGNSFKAKPVTDRFGNLFYQEGDLLQWVGPGGSSTAQIEDWTYTSSINDTLMVLRYTGIDQELNGSAIYDLKNDSILHSRFDHVSEIEHGIIKTEKNGFIGLWDIQKGMQLLPEEFDEVFIHQKNSNLYFMTIQLFDKEEKAEFILWNEEAGRLNSIRVGYGDWSDELF